MSTIELWKFPVPSTCINNGVKLRVDNTGTILRFDYWDEEDNDKVYNCGIIFNATVAYKHSSEKFTKPIREAYDTLIEIKDSEWIKEMWVMSPEWAGFWCIKHYAIYLDSYGLYEFIASSFNILDIKRGPLVEEKV